MQLFLGIIFSLGIQVSGMVTLKLQYDGDQVLHIVPKTLQQVQHLRHLCNTLPLDLWKPLLPEDISTGEDLHMRVPGPLVQEVKDSLDEHLISYNAVEQWPLAIQRHSLITDKLEQDRATLKLFGVDVDLDILPGKFLLASVMPRQLGILEQDVGALLDQSVRRTGGSPRRGPAGYNYTQYHPMDEIYQWMTQVKESNSELVTLHDLGKTSENRTIYYLQISQPSNKNKKIIWMDCGIHAREWISPAFCQWFVKEILQNYKSDPKISRFLQNLDLYILPVLNVDGYIYSWEKERLWRKNRSPHMNGTCYGTDLNRNFNSSWGSIGVSYNCSSNIFCGSGPESEPETRAVAHFIERKKEDIVCYLTIHSYGQYILTPYGSTTKPPSNNEELIQVAEKAAAALMGKYGTSYQVGSTSSILYSNSGSSRDWAHMIGIPFSYTFELRDNGTHGFLLPEDQIEPTCEETMLAVTTIIDAVDQKYFPNAGVTVTSTSLALSLCLGALFTGAV